MGINPEVLRRLLALAPTIVSFHANDVPTAAGTTYLRPWHRNGTSNGNELKIAMPFSGTIRAAHLSCLTAATGGAHTFTIRKNGADQAVTFSVASGVATGSDPDHSFRFDAGDTISVKVVTGAGVTVALNEPIVSLMVTQG